MADDDGFAREIDEEDRQRRQQALRSLAQADQGNVTSTPTDGATSAFSHVDASPLTPPRHSAQRVIIVAMLGVALFAGLGYFAFFRSAPAKTTTTPLVTSSADNNLACIQDLSISPDGASVAILGYRHVGNQPQVCPISDPQNYAYEPGQINIYSITTGHFVSGIQPDDMIANVLHPQIPPHVQPTARTSDISHAVIKYERILWSPDSAQLAVAFSIPLYSTATPENTVASAYTDGVLLTDVQATRPRILAHTSNPFTVYTGAWNLTTGTYISVPANVDQSLWAPAPPALSYTWSSTSALVPQGPLSSAAVAPAPALGPIGSPIGGGAFTIWQPSRVQPIIDTTSSALPLPVPGLFLFSANFPIWSPDGAQLFLDMNVTDMLVAKNHGSTSTAAPLLPMRDKGLSAALADLKPAVHADGSPDVLDVVWHPDGRVLAVSALPPSTQGQENTAPAEVRLYDCASGKLLSTLRGKPLVGTQQAGALYLRWTPDGSYLLMLDTGTGRLTFWGPDQLPKK